MKQLSDGQVALLIRCCDDEKTDSWHTITLTATTTDGDIQAWELDRLSWVQSQHAAANKALAYFHSRKK